MSKDIIYFAENVCGIKLDAFQKDLLQKTQEANDKGELLFVNLGRRQGGQLLNNIILNFQIWSKNQRIADLEEQLKNAKQVIRDIRSYCCLNQVFSDQTKKDKIITAFCDEVIGLIDEKTKDISLWREDE